MSKYEPLWCRIRDNGGEKLSLPFEEIERIAGVPIDHSFLTFKKELLAYGYTVEKISMKNQSVSFAKLGEE